MKKALLLLSLVAIAPLVHAADQSAPKPGQTTPKTNLGAKLVTGSNAVAPLATPRQYTQYTQIDFNWAYTPNIPACGTTLTNCYSGFTLTDTTLGTAIATPSTLGPTALTYVYLPPGGVPYGTSAFSLVANGYDGIGNPLTSTAATVNVHHSKRFRRTAEQQMGKTTDKAQGEKQ
jgi:hypothetical protein